MFGCQWVILCLLDGQCAGYIYRLMNHFRMHYEIPSCPIHKPITSDNWLTFVSTVAYISSLELQPALLAYHLNWKPRQIKSKQNLGNTELSVSFQCVYTCMHCCMLRGGGNLPQWTLWPPPSPAPWAAPRPALGQQPVAAQRGEAGPSGAQSLCRFLGLFTVCRITAALSSPSHRCRSSAHTHMPRAYFGICISVQGQTWQ